MFDGFHHRTFLVFFRVGDGLEAPGPGISTYFAHREILVTTKKISPDQVLRETDDGPPLPDDHGQVWVCYCDGMTFRLFEDGRVQCATCGVMVEEAKIGWTPP